ncbi:HAMP domain-containing histidine kinase, partial [Fulvivirga sp. RKSG066]|nr:HAMP domain-containing histidine kinase [Fulvivirga aurantia]
MADLRTEYEVGQKQAEVDLLTAEKRTQQIVIYAVAGGALIVGVLLIFLYQNNREKIRINRELEEQKWQLQSLNKTKDRFFSIISHDLRGPVAAFSGVSRLIKHAVDQDHREELVEVADDIDHSVSHLSGLLDNLLNWAMHKQGHFPNVPEKLLLNQLIIETKNVYKTMAESKQIALSVS